MKDDTRFSASSGFAAVFSHLAGFGRKLRWLLLVFLLLVLQWPLSILDHLVVERQQRRDAAADEIMSHYGLAQTLVGPIVTVPYRVWTVEERERDGRKETVKIWYRRYAHFLPAELAITAHVTPEIRRRGLFEIPVYNAKLSLEGRFEPPDLSRWSVAASDVLWEEAWLSLEVTDRKALTAPIAFTLGERRMDFEVGEPEGRPIARSLQARLAPSDVRLGAAFEGRVLLRGSGRLAAVPLAAKTTLTMESPWPHPSFDGAYLPEARTVSDRGFQARWSVLRFGRDFGQQWTSSTLDPARVGDSAFGVTFKNPTDLYAQVARSTRYSLLFLVMSFLVLYLWEVMGARPIHALQYLLIGCALMLFYLLELALAEHLGFAPAYGLAAGTTVLLVAGYTRAILASGKSAAVLSAMLAALYGFLFVTLRAEDHALLIGTMGLALLLAAVMYATRRLNRQVVGVVQGYPGDVHGGTSGA